MSDLYSFRFADSAAARAFKNELWCEPESYSARLSLFQLKVLAEIDQLVCLPSLHHIDKHWYQIETAKKVIKQFGGRAMLSDEVGLGKTIEAALICKEYFARGQIKSLLILTPATLVSQWQMELSSKFAHDKINMFELVVGEIETILGNMGDEFDFSETVIDLWLANEDQKQLDTAFGNLGQQLLDAKHSYQEIQEFDSQLFGDEFEA